MKNILVTGGAGFIGSNFVQFMLNKYPQYRIVNFDSLTYAGNLENLTTIEHHPNYLFVKGDICSKEQVTAAFRQYAIDTVVHFAAESHVDRS
ncbi:MAG: GDP-mannose 4,6-dehydratase, partial [Bacteroidota bacterium]